MSQSTSAGAQTQPADEKHSASLPTPDFRVVFDALSAPHLVLQANEPIYTIVAANSAYTAATSTTSEEITGRGVFEVFPDDPNNSETAGVHNFRTSLRRVVDTKAPVALAARKYSIRRPNGEFEAYSWSSVNSPIIGPDGAVQFIVHRVQESSELAEVKQLIKERQLLSLLVERSPEFIGIADLEGRPVYANQAAIDLVGAANFQEVQDVPIANFFVPEEREFVRDVALSVASQQGRWRGELHFLNLRTQEVVPVNYDVFRVDDPVTGQPTHFATITHDLRDLKRAEEELRESEDRFGIAFAEAPIGMVLTSPSGEILEVNQAYLDMLGYSREELALHDSSHFTHPDDIVRTRQFYAYLRDESKTSATLEKRYIRKDGRILWARASATMRHDGQGRPTQLIGIIEDITERKRAENELHQQWKRFDTALSNTPDFTYVFDLQGRFTYVNRALLSLWQKSLDEAVGKNFYELEYPPDLAGQLQRQIQQVIDTKEPVRDQTPFTGPDGETRYYEYIFVPVLGANGRVEAVAGSTRDITDRNRAELLVEEDRRRWRELLLQAPAAIAVLRGPEHRFEWANLDYLRLVGRPIEDIVGKTVIEAIPEVETQAYVALLDDVYRTGTPFVGHESPFEVRRDDGALQNVFVNFVYLPTRNDAGEIDGILVHATEVTEMVLTRKRIEESERQFRTLAETIPHLAWMADETGHIFWYNRRWYDYTGTTIESMEGWGWQKIHDPSLLPEVLDQWRTALSTGEPFEMVFPLRGADESFRTFLTRVEPVRDNEGRVARWFGTNTDITEQRRTEEELRRMNRELEEFAYVSSHDLQEPLRMVNVYTQLILKRLGNGDETLNQYAAFVRQGATRMEALIDDLLKFSRTVHTEEQPLALVDLGEALGEALAVLKNRIEENDAVVTAEPLPQVRADTQQMAHVFQNLIANALKYRKPDTPPRILISVAVEQSQCIVSVSDNGIGFEQQYAERIFGLFKRLHKDAYPGTGLGLAICKRIVERYGGRMWAEGRPGKGSTFHFSLPCASDR